MMLEAFAPAPPPTAGETPAQSNAIARQQVASAQKSLAAGWNASKHPRAQGGKFGYTTGGKRATRAHSTRHSTRTSSRSSSPRVLGQGSTGALVKSIQHQLNIPADGKYGPQTHAAIARYQQQHHLQVDGVVGRQTLAALRGSVNARLIAPGPISSKQARVGQPRHAKPKVTPQQRAKMRANAKSAAQLRATKANFAGGVVV
jgi:hypothetical protein